MSKRATIGEMLGHLHAAADDWRAVQLWISLYLAYLRGVKPWEPTPADWLNPEKLDAADWCAKKPEVEE